MLPPCNWYGLLASSNLKLKGVKIERKTFDVNSCLLEYSTLLSVVLVVSARFGHILGKLWQ